MDFQTAVKTCLSNYATFTGRAARPEFWWFVLFGIIVHVIANMIDRILFGGTAVHTYAGGMSMSMYYHPRFLGSIASLVLLLPNLAAGARRLHDTGKSAWLLLLVLVPVIGWLALLYFYVQPGDAGANTFGPPPVA